MSMGYLASYADVISEQFVTEIVGKKLMDEFSVKRDEADGGMGEGTDSEHLEDFSSDFVALSKRICRKFHRNTGLRLSWAYHDKQNSYDEVDGFFWFVDNAYTLTDAGKKYRRRIARKFYVIFG